MKTETGGDMKFLCQSNSQTVYFMWPIKLYTHQFGSLRKVYDLTLAATVFTSNMAAV